MTANMREWLEADVTLDCDVGGRHGAYKGTTRKRRMSVMSEGKAMRRAARMLATEA